MNPPDAQRGPIEFIAIGASAGGVGALGQILRALPAGFAIPIAIVLHIPPERSSLLPELFATHCAVPVKEVEDKEPVRPGTVYVAAPDYHMLVEPDRSFALSQDEAVNYSRPSIDLLFESAALAYGARVLGGGLTGGSADGADGLAAIRGAGGQGWVQRPDEAEAPAMPLFAIERAGADRILGMTELARDLAGLARPNTI